MIVLLITISTVVAVALLAKELPNLVYYVVVAFSGLDPALGYRVEMDLALIDAGHL